LTNQTRLAESFRAKEEKMMTEKMINTFLKLKIWKDTHGQDLTEYALMAGFLAAASGFTLPQLATGISNVLSAVVIALAGTGGGTSAPGA
jgi:pilus assembly protein Flp/PilA